MRAAGILLHISSLPSRFGVGTLGAEAYHFVDFLVAAKQTYWQILPIGPTGFGDSPYQSFSAFASNPYFIDPDILCKEGYLLPKELNGLNWGKDKTQVDYGLLYKTRHTLLEKATSRLQPDDAKFVAFCKQKESWLDDYSFFMAIKAKYGQVSWYEWPVEVRTRDEVTLARLKKQLAADIHHWKALEYFFDCQWTALKAYANKNGVQIIGDIPIYVSPDSSDIWANPELFQVDEEGKPSRVAGCPPDAFSDDGQLWGNPLYDWDYHYSTGYDWWCRRLAHAGTIYDVVRIDHFRGFESYYSIAADEKTARVGKWCKGPGMDFIYRLHKNMPDLPIIAEDLGFVTNAVVELLEASGYPGMKVLQFAFDSREDGDYLPHHYKHNQVVYTGTHDNNTTAGWALDAPKEDVAYARQYIACNNGSIVDGFVRSALLSACDTAIIPLQDWLELGSEARMNVPSTTLGNWRWRVKKEDLSPELCQHIAQLTQMYGRLRAKPEKAAQ